jgi:hypothetical protein
MAFDDEVEAIDNVKPESLFSFKISEQNTSMESQAILCMQQGRAGELRTSSLERSQRSTRRNLQPRIASAAMIGCDRSNT